MVLHLQRHLATNCLACQDIAIYFKVIIFKMNIRIIWIIICVIYLILLHFTARITGHHIFEDITVP